MATVQELLDRAKGLSGIAPGLNIPDPYQCASKIKNYPARAPMATVIYVNRAGVATIGKVTA